MTKNEITDFSGCFGKVRIFQARVALGPKSVDFYPRRRGGVKIYKFRAQNYTFEGHPEFPGSFGNPSQGTRATKTRQKRSKKPAEACRRHRNQITRKKRVVLETAEKRAGPPQLRSLELPPRTPPSRQRRPDGGGTTSLPEALRAWGDSGPESYGRIGVIAVSAIARRAAPAGRSAARRVPQAPRAWTP